MASSILNSDDGVISGTSGLKSSGGDDGVLVFQSKGTETARINTDKQIVAAAGTASLPALTTTGDLNTGIFFPAADTTAIATSGTERMRIDSSGRWGVGMTPSAWSGAGKTIQFGNGPAAIGTQNSGDANFLHNAYENPSGTFKYASSGIGALRYHLDINNNIHAWYTAASGTADNNISWSERMRIDSSGNVMVGTTTASGKVRFYQTADSTTLTLTSAQTGFLSSNQAVLQITTTAGTSNPTTSFAIRSSYNGSGVFDARNDGTLYAQNTTVQSISDVRTKENIRDAEDGLDVITALRPVRFDFKEGFNNNRKNQLGFIAQEIEQVFPDAVDVSPQEDENGNPYKSVGPGALIPVLVKAIQELSAKNDALEARIAALEAVPGNE